MDNLQLFIYIKHKKCLCCLCYDLKQKILDEGIEALYKYDGFQCSNIVDWMSKKQHNINDSFDLEVANIYAKRYL